MFGDEKWEILVAWNLNKEIKRNMSNICLGVCGR